jgi:hypothetical protein
MTFAGLLPALLLLAMPPAEPPRGAPSKPEDLRMLHDYARCVVEANPTQSRRILKLDYRTDSYRRSLGNIAGTPRSCAAFDGRLRMAQLLLAGAFAEALLPRALAGRPLAAAAAPDPAKAAIAARDDGEYLGLCGVRTMPEQVATLLATAPASDEEKSAVAAITPGLGPCLRAGAAAKLNRPALRALLALAAYRIVGEAGPAAARTGKD